MALGSGLVGAPSHFGPSHRKDTPNLLTVTFLANVRGAGAAVRKVGLIIAKFQDQPANSMPHVDAVVFSHKQRLTSSAPKTRFLLQTSRDPRLIILQFNFIQNYGYVTQS